MTTVTKLQLPPVFQTIIRINESEKAMLQLILTKYSQIPKGLPLEAGKYQSELFANELNRLLNKE